MLKDQRSVTLQIQTADSLPSRIFFQQQFLRLLIGKARFFTEWNSAQNLIGIQAKILEKFSSQLLRQNNGYKSSKTLNRNGTFLYFFFFREKLMAVYFEVRSYLSGFSSQNSHA